MSEDIQAIAQKVVQRFKQELSKQTSGSLSDADFEHLVGLIRVALSEEREDISRQLEELARKLRADTEHFDLNL